MTRLSECLLGTDGWINFSLKREVKDLHALLSAVSDVYFLIFFRKDQNRIPQRLRVYEVEKPCFYFILFFFTFQNRRSRNLVEVDQQSADIPHAAASEAEPNPADALKEGVSLLGDGFVQLNLSSPSNDLNLSLIRQQPDSF